MPEITVCLATYVNASEVLYSYLKRVHSKQLKQHTEAYLDSSIVNPARDA